MKRKTGKQLILLLFLLFAVTALQNFIQQRSRASLLHTDTCFTESFREQALSPLLYQQLEAGNYTDGEFADLLTATMLNQRFYPKKISGDNCPYLRFKQDEYLFLKDCYSAIWNDLETFPIPPGPGRTFRKRFPMKTPLAPGGIMAAAAPTRAVIFLAGFQNPDFIQ